MSTTTAFPEWQATAKFRRKPDTPRRADLNDLPEWIERVHALPEIRWAKVESVRRALTEGTYDVDHHLEQLANHLPDELTTLAIEAM